MRKLCVLTILLFLLISTETSAIVNVPIRCGRSYTMVLDGEYSNRWKEHMELEKVRKTGGIDGRWKVTKWTIRMDHPPLPPQIPVPSVQTDHVDLKEGMWIDTRITTNRTYTLVEIIRSHWYLDVLNNRIGFKKNNLWVGRIRGNDVELQFFQPAQLERRGFHVSQAKPSTLLKGKLYIKGRKVEGTLTIVEPAEKEVEILFDEDNPPSGKIVVRAVVTPAILGGYVTWELDKIRGTEVKVNRIDKYSAEIIFTGLPKGRDIYRSHRLKVSYESGGCSAVAYLSIRFKDLCKRELLEKYKRKLERIRRGYDKDRLLSRFIKKVLVEFIGNNPFSKIVIKPLEKDFEAEVTVENPGQRPARFVLNVDPFILDPGVPVDHIIVMLKHELVHVDQIRRGTAPARNEIRVKAGWGERLWEAKEAFLELEAYQKEQELLFMKKCASEFTRRTSRDDLGKAKERLRKALEELNVAASRPVARIWQQKLEKWVRVENPWTREHWKEKFPWEK